MYLSFLVRAADGHRTVREIDCRSGHTVGECRHCYLSHFGVVPSVASRLGVYRAVPCDGDWSGVFGPSSIGGERIVYLRAVGGAGEGQCPCRCIECSGRSRRCVAVYNLRGNLGVINVQTRDECHGFDCGVSAEGEDLGVSVA